MPHYLFPGRLQRWAQQQAADWASQHPNTEVRVAEVIGACDELAAVVVDRYLSAATDAEEAPQLYLSALVLRDRKVVIAGAGRVASRRVGKLLEAGADLHVVAPTASPQISQLATDGLLNWTPREVTESDLADAWYALALTDSPEVNAQVAAWAEQRQVFCVRSDDAAGGSAWTPATGSTGGLIVGVVGDRHPHRSARARTAAVAALRAAGS